MSGPEQQSTTHNGRRKRRGRDRTTVPPVSVSTPSQAQSGGDRSVRREGRRRRETGHRNALVEAATALGAGAFGLPAPERTGVGPGRPATEGVAEITTPEVTVESIPALAAAWVPKPPPMSRSVRGPEPVRAPSPVRSPLLQRPTPLRRRPSTRTPDRDRGAFAAASTAIGPALWGTVTALMDGQAASAMPRVLERLSRAGALASEQLRAPRPAIVEPGAPTPAPLPRPRRQAAPAPLQLDQQISDRTTAGARRALGRLHRRATEGLTHARTGGGRARGDVGVEREGRDGPALEEMGRRARGEADPEQTEATGPGRQGARTPDAERLDLGPLSLDLGALPELVTQFMQGLLPSEDGGVAAGDTAPTPAAQGPQTPQTPAPGEQPQEAARGEAPEPEQAEQEPETGPLDALLDPAGAVVLPAGERTPELADSGPTPEASTRSDATGTDAQDQATPAIVPDTPVVGWSPAAPTTTEAPLQAPTTGEGLAAAPITPAPQLDPEAGAGDAQQRADRIAALREELAFLQVKIANLEGWLAEARERLDRSQTSLADHQSEDARLQQRQAETQGSLQELGAEQLQLQQQAMTGGGDDTELSRTDDHRKRQEARLARTERSRTQLERESSRTEAVALHEEQEVTDLDAELGEAREDQQEVQEELDSLTAGAGGGGGAGGGAAPQAALDDAMGAAEQSITDAYQGLSASARDVMSEVEAAVTEQLAVLHQAHQATADALTERLDAERQALTDTAAQLREQVQADVQARRDATDTTVAETETGVQTETDSLTQTATDTTVEEQVALLEAAQTRATEVRTQAETEATETLRVAQEQAQEIRDDADSEASDLESQASEAESETDPETGESTGGDRASELRSRAREVRAEGERKAQERIARGEADAAEIRARGEAEATALLEEAASASDVLQAALDTTLGDLATEADAAIADAEGDADAIEAALDTWESDALSAVEDGLAAATDALDRARTAAMADLDAAAAEQEAALQADLTAFADGIAGSDGADPAALEALRDQQLAAIAAAGAEASAVLEQVAAAGEVLAATAVGASQIALDREAPAATAAPPRAATPAEAPAPSPLLDQVLDLDAVDLVLAGVSTTDALSLTDPEAQIGSWADIDALVDSGQLDTATRDALYAEGASRYLAGQQVGDGPLSLYVATYDETSDDPEQLGIAAEQAALEEGLDGATALVALTNPTPRELEAILAAGDFTGAFVGGHGAADGGLTLPGPDGQRVPVPAAEVASILGAEETLTGVFLNVCGSEGSGDEALMQALTAEGVASLSWAGGTASAEQAVPMAEAVAIAFSQTGDLESAFRVAGRFYGEVLAPRVNGDPAALRMGDDGVQGDTTVVDAYGDLLSEAVVAGVDLEGLDTIDGDETWRQEEVVTDGGGGGTAPFDLDWVPDVSGDGTLDELDRLTSLPDYGSMSMGGMALTPFQTLAPAGSQDVVTRADWGQWGDRGYQWDYSVGLGGTSAQLLSPFDYREQNVLRDDEQWSDADAERLQEQFYETGVMPLEGRRGEWSVAEGFHYGDDETFGFTRDGDGWVVDSVDQATLADPDYQHSLDYSAGDPTWMLTLQTDLADVGFLTDPRQPGPMWDAYGGYLAEVPGSDDPVTYGQFWAETMVSVMNTPPDQIGDLPPVAQELAVRGLLASATHQQVLGSDIEGLPQTPEPWAVFDVLPVLDQIDDPALQQELLTATLEAAGPDALEHLETWAQERAPELGEAIVDARGGTTAGTAAPFLLEQYGADWALSVITDPAVDADLRAGMAADLLPALSANVQTEADLTAVMVAQDALFFAIAEGADASGLNDLLLDSANRRAAGVATEADQVLLSRAIGALGTSGVSAQVAEGLSAAMIYGRPFTSIDAAEADRQRFMALLQTDGAAALLQGAATPEQSATLLGHWLDTGMSADGLEDLAGGGMHDEATLQVLFGPLFEDWASAQADGTSNGNRDITGGSRESVEDLVAWSFVGGLADPTMDADLRAVDADTVAQVREGSQAVTDRILELGGDGDFSVEVVPIQYTADSGGEMLGFIGGHEEMAMTMPLYQVRDADGTVVGLVDNQGNRYDDMDQYVDINPLPDGRLTFPVLDDNGHVQMEGGQPQMDTAETEDTQDFWDDAAMVVGLVGGAIIIAGSGGSATPLVVAGFAAVGFSSVVGLHEGYQTLSEMNARGQSIDPLESWSNAAIYADLVANALGVVTAGGGIFKAARGISRLGLLDSRAFQLGSDLLDYGAGGLQMLDVLTNPDATSGDVATAAFQTLFYSVVLPAATNRLGELGASAISDTNTRALTHQISNGELPHSRILEAYQAVASDGVRPSDDDIRIVQLAQENGLADPSMFEIYQRNGGPPSPEAAASDPQAARDLRIWQERNALTTTAAGSASPGTTRPATLPWDRGGPLADSPDAQTALAGMHPGEWGVAELLSMSNATDIGQISQDMPQFLQDVPPEQLTAWVDALADAGLDRQGLLRDALIVQGDGTDSGYLAERAAGYESLVQDGGGAPLPPDEVASRFAAHLGDATVTADVVAMLAALPDDPAYREAFFQSLTLGEGASPQGLIDHLSTGEGGLTPLETELVLSTFGGTTWGQAATLAIADQALAAGDRSPAELAALLATHPTALSPTDQAIVASLTGRGLYTERAITLHLAQQDGDLDLANPAVQQQLLDPLSQTAQDLRDGVIGADADLVRMLEDAHAVGGTDLVARVLGSTDLASLSDTLPPAALERLATLTEGTPLAASVAALTPGEVQRTTVVDRPTAEALDAITTADSAEALADVLVANPTDGTAVLFEAALAELGPADVAGFYDRLEQSGVNPAYLVDRMHQEGLLTPEAARALIDQAVGTPQLAMIRETANAAIAGDVMGSMSLDQLVALQSTPADQLSPSDRAVLEYLNDPRLAEISGTSGHAYPEVLPSPEAARALRDAGSDPAALASATSDNGVLFGMAMEQLQTPADVAAYFDALWARNPPMPPQILVQEMTAAGLMTPERAVQLTDLSAGTPDATAISALANGAAARQVLSDGVSLDRLAVIARADRDSLSAADRVVVDALGGQIPSTADLAAVRSAEGPEAVAALVTAGDAPNPLLFAAAIEALPPGQAGPFLDALVASGVDPANLAHVLGDQGLLGPDRSAAVLAAAEGTPYAGELTFVVEAARVGGDLRQMPPEVLAGWVESVIGEPIPELEAVLGDIEADGYAAYLRRPGYTAIPEYAANATDATRFFLYALERGGTMDPLQLERVTAAMQAMVSGGTTGDNTFQHPNGYHTRDLPWGVYRDRLQPYNQAGGNFQDWLRTSAAAYGVDTPDFGSSPDVPGVDPAYQALNLGGLIRYPHFGGEGQYLGAASTHLDTVIALRETDAGSPAYEEAMARYFHTAASAHFFDRVNLSVLQSQVNAIRMADGLDPIVIDDLDMAAQRMDQDDFVTLFTARAAGQLPLEAGVVSVRDANTTPDALAAAVVANQEHGPLVLAQQALDRLTPEQQVEFFQQLEQQGLAPETLDRLTNADNAAGSSGIVNSDAITSGDLPDGWHVVQLGTPEWAQAVDAVHSYDPSTDTLLQPMLADNAWMQTLDVRSGEGQESAQFRVLSTDDFNALTISQTEPFHISDLMWTSVPEVTLDDGTPFIMSDHTGDFATDFSVHMLHEYGHAADYADTLHQSLLELEGGQDIWNALTGDGITNPADALIVHDLISTYNNENQRATQDLPRFNTEDFRLRQQREIGAWAQIMPYLQDANLPGSDAILETALQGYGVMDGLSEVAYHDGASAIEARPAVDSGDTAEGILPPSGVDPGPIVVRHDDPAHGSHQVAMESYTLNQDPAMRDLVRQPGMQWLGDVQIGPTDRADGANFMVQRPADLLARSEPVGMADLFLIGYPDFDTGNAGNYAFPSFSGDTSADFAMAMPHEFGHVIDYSTFLTDTLGTGAPGSDANAVWERLSYAHDMTPDDGQRILTALTTGSGLTDADDIRFVVDVLELYADLGQPGFMQPATPETVAQEARAWVAAMPSMESAYDVDGAAVYAYTMVNSYAQSLDGTPMTATRFAEVLQLGGLSETEALRYADALPDRYLLNLDFAPRMAANGDTTGIRDASVDGRPYSINSGHAWTREHQSGVTPESTRIPQDALETTIVQDLDAFVASGGTVPAPGSTNFDRTITIDGVEYGYRSVRLPNGEVRIPTYWVNP